MRLKPTAATRSMSMRRDARYVERKLREMARRPRSDDVLDIDKVRHDVQRQVDAIAPERLTESVYEAIDKLVDNYVDEFLSRMRARHDEELSELDRLRIKINPYLSQANALMGDQKNVIGYFDMAVTHALDRLVDGETPLTDPRYRTEPGKDTQ